MELLPEEYCGQKSAWMNSEISHAWFHNSFIPTVREELSSLGLEPKLFWYWIIAVPTPMKKTSLVMMETSLPFTCHQMSLP